MNPVVAGIVEKPDDYIYSSTKNNMEKTGIIDVEILDFIGSDGDGFISLSS